MKRYKMTVKPEESDSTVISPFENDLPNTEVQAADEATQPRSQNFLVWRMIVVITLLVSYTGYYFNRSNLSVAQSSILKDTGLNQTEFGTVISVGYGVYAVGKFVNGVAIDYVGGRPMFLIGLVGSAVFTVLFTLFDTIAGFTAMWSINRFLQSVGWGALVKITSRWFDSQEYGRIMGVMSLSYLLGDAIIRLIFGLVLNAGVTWQQLFYLSAAIAIAIAVPAFFTLKASPIDIGEKEPRTSDKNVFGKTAGEASASKGSIWSLLKPILSNLKFWMLITMSIVLTLIRETFNSWSPTYFKEALDLSDGDASIASLVFPLFGTFSAIAGGWLVDRVPNRYRGGVPIIFLLGLAAALLGLWAFDKYFIVTDETRTGAIILDIFLVGMTGLVLLAPYSFVDGVFALEISGKRGAAVTVSMINGAGYVGAIMAGYVTGLMAERLGWGAVFLMLAGLAGVTILAASVFWLLDVRDIQQLEEDETTGLLSGDKQLKQAV